MRVGSSVTRQDQQSVNAERRSLNRCPRKTVLLTSVLALAGGLRSAHLQLHSRWTGPMLPRTVLFLGALLTWPELALVGQTRKPGQWRVQAALVLAELEVRPLPLFAFRLVSAADSTFVIQGRTGLDGRSTGTAPEGNYHLISNEPATVGGVGYSWRVPLEILPGAETAVELTNINAQIDSSGVTQPSLGAGRRLEDAVTAFRRLRSGVFRVEAGAGHGSGFLIDSVNGLVVTNAHVVTNQRSSSVVLDSVTRVRAVILARREDHDVALLLVNPEVTRDRPALHLAQARASSSIVEPGERVLVIGFPLDQEQVLTTGIVSSVRSGAIISDVNINPGNSGGPMLNYSGDVVGIATFGSQDGRGPGIAGAIVATEVWPAVEAARIALDTIAPPPATLLPTMPLTQYRVELLRSHADTLNPKRIRDYTVDDIGPFDIEIASPVILYLRARTYDAEVARDRRRREERAGVAENERYSGLKEFRDWYRFAANEFAPLVQIKVSPKVGETTGSAFGRALAAALAGVPTKGTFKFQGDVSEVRFFRNGYPIELIRGGTTPIEQYIDEQWVSLKDVANFGAYMLSPLAFAPDTAGTPPSIQIEVLDLKKQNEPRCGELPRKVVAHVWNDFLPYLRTQLPDRVAVRADPNHNPVYFWTRSVIPGDTLLAIGHVCGT